MAQLNDQFAKIVTDQIDELARMLKSLTDAREVGMVGSEEDARIADLRARLADVERLEAEHQNGYHVDNEPGCPMCLTDGPFIRV